MKLSTFEALLDRHGPDLEAWPAAEVAAARAFVERSPEARRAHAAALRVESWIAASRPRVDQASVHQVVARALAEVRQAAEPRRPVLGVRWGGVSWSGLASRFGMPMPQLAFAVAATLVGFAIGIMLGTPASRLAVHPSGLPVIASAGDVLF